MKLTKVIINNFRSFGESQIIELNNKVSSFKKAKSFDLAFL